MRLRVEAATGGVLYDGWTATPPRLDEKVTADGVTYTVVDVIRHFVNGTERVVVVVQ